MFRNRTNHDDKSRQIEHRKNTYQRASCRNADLFFLALGLLGLAFVAFQGPRACAAESGDTVARVGAESISLEELENYLEAELGQLNLRRQQLLQDGLERLVEDRLLAQEARQRKISVDQLLEKEVALQVAEVTDQDIETWYQQNRTRVGRPLEQIAGQVRSFLETQRQQGARGTFIASIRSRTETRILLAPPRIAIPASPSTATKGRDEAAVTIVEFSDFQCPACRKMATILDEVRSAYGDAVRVEFRHFPLEDIHPEARKASEAALCAGEQDLFWQMHDDLFQNQRALKPQQIQERADALGLESAAFEACLESGRHSPAVTADLEAGRKAGVGGTPSLFVNGRPVGITRLDTALQDLKVVIDDELQRRAFEAAGSEPASPSG
ncbi:MAG: thioredoxin domain-containing protein [Deltaproteobacteria bacterium]|nr:thioredoxin domain-containing protein [Deltaproteobacteria bacterium]